MDESSKSVTFNDIYPIIKEQLELNGEVRFKPRGTSMLPLIRQGKDEVIVKKLGGNLNKFDIVFYCRKNGDFVLHRFIGFDKNGGYIMRGDNQTFKEYGISNDNIIGVVKSVVRGGELVIASTPLFNAWVYYSRIYVPIMTVHRKIKNLSRRILCLSKKK